LIKGVFLGILKGSKREIKRIHRSFFTTEARRAPGRIRHRLTPTAQNMPPLKMVVGPMKAKEES
jgi:hypothetical protein